MFFKRLMYLQNVDSDVFAKVDTWAGAQAQCDTVGGFLVQARLVKAIFCVKSLFSSKVFSRNCFLQQCTF